MTGRTGHSFESSSPLAAADLMALVAWCSALTTTSTSPGERKTPFLTRPPVIVTVLVLFLASMNHLLKGDEGFQPEPQVEAAAAEVSVMVAAEMVKQYRRDHGELPPSLSAVGLSEERYKYQRGRDGDFLLEATTGTQSVRYNTSEGPVELVRAMASQSGGQR